MSLSFPSANTEREYLHEEEGRVQCILSCNVKLKFTK